MIRPGFLDSESRQDLIELMRDGSVAHRLARRANALILLDDGMNCKAVAKVLYLDDDTIRNWHRLYQEDGIEGRRVSATKRGVPADGGATGPADSLDCSLTESCASW